MESDKESGRVDGIQAISNVVVGNGYGGRRLRAQNRARSIAEIHLKRLRSFQVRVINDENRYSFGSFTRRKLHGSKSRLVVAARRGRAVFDIAILRAGGIAGRKAYGGRSRRVATASNDGIDFPIALVDCVIRRAKLNCCRSWRWCRSWRRSRSRRWSRSRRRRWRRSWRRGRG